MASAPTMSTMTDGVNSLLLSPAFTVDLPIRPNPTTAILDMWLPFVLALVCSHRIRGADGPSGRAHARRYRITATGVKTATSSAHQARARPTSLLEPVSSERTASTIAVIGWYFENGCSQPGIEVAGT